MLREDICCPCAEKRPLVECDKDLACTGETCPHASQPHQFKRYGATPVLIAFERTDTICDPALYETASTYVPRKNSKLMNGLRALVYSISQTTIRNCDRFVELVKASAIRPKVLIIGSGSSGAGTDRLWGDPSIDRTGIDIYFSPTVDFVADAHYLPFKDKSFEGVWIQAVLEHVASPAEVVAEIGRVLKPGGVVYAETPFMQQVHEGPYDFGRYTVTGHRFLFKNFELIDMGGNGGPCFVLAWSVKYLVWGLTRSKVAGNAAAVPLYLAARFLDRLVSEKSLWDASSGVFFLGQLGDGEPAKMKDLPALYRGFQR